MALTYILQYDLKGFTWVGTWYGIESYLAGF